jgi:hypothetical protein
MDNAGADDLAAWDIVAVGAINSDHAQRFLLAFGFLVIATLKQRDGPGKISARTIERAEPHRDNALGEI